MRAEILRRLLAVTPEEQAILGGAPLDLGNYNQKGEASVDPGVLLPRGELFGIRRHTRFVDFPRHGHQYVEMVYQVQGKTEHLVDGVNPVTLTAGKLLLLSRGTEHEIRAAGRDDIAVNFILIPMFFDNAAISLGENNALAVFLKGNLQRNQPKTGHLLYDVSASPATENLLENLVVGQLEGIDLDIQQLTLELLLRHLSRLTDSLVVNNREDMERALVLNVLSQIERHVQINLSELAQKYGVGVSALSRMVKKHTGCGFTELLHTARFHRAAVLLRETDCSIVSIAAMVGYENTAFFYRRFGEMYGCTPMEYRRRRRLQNPI